MSDPLYPDWRARFEAVLQAEYTLNRGVPTVEECIELMHASGCPYDPKTAKEVRTLAKSYVRMQRGLDGYIRIADGYEAMLQGILDQQRKL